MIIQYTRIQLFISDQLSLVLDDKYREAVINLSLLFYVSVGWGR